jgi:hypothetical protein
MISKVYMPWSSVSQISLIFFTARNERSEEPAMYSRNRCPAALLRFEAAFSRLFWEATDFGLVLRGIMKSIAEFLGQLQPDEGLPSIAKVADDFSNRLRQPANERGDGNDLVIPRQLRFLH